MPRRRGTRRFQLLVIIMAGSAASVMNAQTAPSPVTRLGDLYARLSRDNPKISAAQALARAAEARVPGARRPPDPQVQLGFMNYALPSLRPMASIGMTQLQLMQMMPLGSKLTLAERIASAQADATGARAADVAWELHRQMAMAFYDLYATNQQLDVARATVRLLQSISRTAESMYSVGEGRQADVLRANLEIAKMAADTLRMQAMRKTMTARLNALLNRNADEPIGPVARPPFPDTLPLQSWMDSIAANERPMLRANLQDVRAADASSSLARKEIIPDLQIGLQYGRGSTTMVDAAGVIARRVENMGSLMIGATIPFFARDRQFRMRSEANAMKAMAQADLFAMRAETLGKIGEAYTDLAQARDLARLYRTTVLPTTEATVASALSSYRVGKVDFMTLLDAQMAVNKFRQELFRLEADEGKAWAELEMLTGRELIDANSIAVVFSDGAAARGGDR
jgi:outer membrane protein TolC